MSQHARDYEADEAILRVEAPRVPRHLVSPVKNAATDGEPEAEDDGVTTGPLVQVEIGPGGARIHLRR